MPRHPVEAVEVGDRASAQRLIKQVSAFRPVACDQVPRARGGGQGTETPASERDVGDHLPETAVHGLDQGLLLFRIGLLEKTRVFALSTPEMLLRHRKGCLSWNIEKN
jgi:hypothetical protein